MRAVIEQTIQQQPNVKHVFLEGKNEFEKGEYLQDLADNGSLTIQPCLPLDDLVTFIAKATLVIAPDTGIRNVAISTHTPTVGIFMLRFPFVTPSLWSAYYRDECEWWKAVYWANYLSDWYNIKNALGCSQKHTGTMNMSKVTVLIANRLIRLTGNLFKMLSYPFHWVFPKLRFTIPAYSPAKLKMRANATIPRTIWQTNFTDQASL